MIIRLGEADITQTQSQTQRLRIAKINFKSVRHTILYDGELFVVGKPLKTKRKKLPHTKQESLQIKVLYSRLRRSINHSQMKQNLAQHVAEHIWRYKKSNIQLFIKLIQ